MHAEDKLYRIQSKDINGTKQLSQHLSRWDCQYDNRIKVIKDRNQRMHELTEKVKGKLPLSEDIENIKKVQAELRHVKT